MWASRCHACQERSYSVLFREFCGVIRVSKQGSGLGLTPPSLFALIAIPYLTTGRSLFSLNQCLIAARSTAASVVESLIEEAIDHDLKTIAMERAWMRANKVSSARGDA